LLPRFLGPDADVPAPDVGDELGRACLAAVVVPETVGEVVFGARNMQIVKRITAQELDRPNPLPYDVSI